MGGRGAGAVVLRGQGAAEVGGGGGGSGDGSGDGGIEGIDVDGYGDDHRAHPPADTLPFAPYAAYFPHSGLALALARGCAG